jgi:hypothetical protein
VLSSVPITISGKEYHLRYTYQDFKVMENTLGIGYLHFIRPEIFGSLTALETFLWRGLKKETGDGQFIAAFPLDEKGRESVGELLWSYIQEGGDVGILSNAVLDAFTTTGPFRKREPDEVEDKKPKGKPKNSKT